MTWLNSADPRNKKCVPKLYFKVYVSNTCFLRQEMDRLNNNYEQKLPTV